MILTEKEAYQVLGAFTPEEQEAINAFLHEQLIVNAAIEQFALVKGAWPAQPLESVEDVMKWNRCLDPNMTVTASFLCEFMYGVGTMRILNFWIVQLLGIDRKKSPAIAARVLPTALQLAHLQGCHLHTIWFAARIEELKGNRPMRELAEMPIRLMDNEKVKENSGQPNPEFIESVEMVDRQRQAWVQAAIEQIAAKVAKAQAQDFDLDATSIQWWPGGVGVEPHDMSKCYYFPMVEAMEVVVSLDPEERRHMDATLKKAHLELSAVLTTIKRLMLEMLEMMPIIPETEAMRQEMIATNQKANAPKEELDPAQQVAVVFGDNVKLNISMHFYWLMRAFDNEEPSSKVLWNICMLENYLRRGQIDLAARVWESCKPALDFHISPIIGLWVLDLRRQLIHLQAHGESSGADLAWLHALENKFVKALQQGNYTSES